MRYKKYEKIKDMLLLYHEKIHDNRANIIQTVRNDICFNSIAMFDRRYERYFFIDDLINIADDSLLFIGHHADTYTCISFLRKSSSILDKQCVFLIKNNEV